MPIHKTLWTPPYGNIRDCWNRCLLFCDTITHERSKSDLLSCEPWVGFSPCCVMVPNHTSGIGHPNSLKRTGCNRKEANGKTITHSLRSGVGDILDINHQYHPSLLQGVVCVGDRAHWCGPDCP